MLRLALKGVKADVNFNVTQKDRSHERCKAGLKREDFPRGKIGVVTCGDDYVEL